MLGAIFTLLLVAAAAYAVTQVGGVITLLFIAAVLVLAYRRLSLLAFTSTFTVLLVAYTWLGDRSVPAGIWTGFLWLLLASLWLLNVRPLRKAIITRPFMKAYLKLLPPMSQTEREALEAGTVWWDGELFTGAPKWSKLLAAKAPALSAEEQAFLDGPCEELCRMLDDWNITHERGDMPPHVRDVPVIEHPAQLFAGTVEEGVIYSYPVTIKDGAYQIVQGLSVDEFSRKRMDATEKELREERDGVKDLL